MEFSQNLRFAHLQLQMDTSAKYKANQTEIVGGVVRTSILMVNQGQYSLILHRIFMKVASYTSTTPNEHFCQVQSESDRNCKRSCLDKHF